MNRSWFVGVVVLAVFASGCTNVEVLKRQNADLQAQLAASRAEGDSLRDELTLLEEQNRALSARLGEAEVGVRELEELRQRLGSEVELTLRGGLVTIELPDKVLYRSGEAKLTDSGKTILRKVAGALKSEFADHFVRVEGHTDSDPIRRTGNLYKSNWELSAVRALEVVHYLTEQCGLDSKQVHAAAFGEHQPVAPNTTAANKQKNRRVAVVVLPRT